MPDDLHDEQPSRDDVDQENLDKRVRSGHWISVSDVLGVRSSFSLGNSSFHRVEKPEKGNGDRHVTHYTKGKGKD